MLYRPGATKDIMMDEEKDGGKSRAMLAAFEQAAADVASQSYVLSLYVTGTTPKSIRAIANLRRICEEYLDGRYDLEVIDLYQQPELAEGNHIVAAPTLIKKLPAPLRRLIGDMSDTDKVLIGLDLKPKNEAGGVRLGTDVQR